MKRVKETSFLLALVILFTSFLTPMQSLATSQRDLSLESFNKTEVNSSEKFRVIVQTKSARDKSSLKASLTKSDKNKILKDYDLVFNGFSVELTESDYLKLMMDKRVEKVTKAKVFYPLMTSSKVLGQVFEAQDKFKNKGEGMVISIIDSGLDLTHKDFQKLDDPSKAKIKDITPFGGENTDTKFTIKVPYGYNFADNSYRIKGYESDHGIHVAGIAGANSDDNQLSAFDGIDGVASQAQILSMGVFSNNPEHKGALEDDIIAAIEKSIEKDADIINMSLGTESGFMDDNDPTSLAIKKAKDKGILVVVAAGNDTAAFSVDAKKGIDNPFNRTDIGVVGSPSTYRDSFSVASYENTNTFVYKFNFNDGDKKLEFDYQLDNGDFEEKPYKIVEAGLGSEDDFKDKKFEGKLAFIKRGGNISFVDKATRAKNAGAVGAIIYNTDNSKFKMSLSGIGDYPVFNISNSVGLKLLEAYKKNNEIEVNFGKKSVRVPNDTSGEMSDFTSFGSTPDLDIKPEITGIGGQVYSTVNDGKYAINSGTSMASPYVSGVAAIVYSQVRKDVKNIGNVAEFTRKTMMNTAKILYNTKVSATTPFSVRRQGSGLVQTKDAIDNRVILSFENENGNAAGELRNFNGVKSFNIHLKNYSDKDLSFKVKANGVYTTETVDKILKETPAKASIKFDKDIVKVSANSSSNVKVTLNANGVVDNFVEGFVEFISQDNDQPSLSFPYMGFVGDYNKESIMDNLDTIENKNGTLYKDTRLVSMIKDPRNIFDQGRIFTLGLSISDLKTDKKPSQEMWSISPNGDGFADVAIPQLGMLRNAKTLEFNLLDSNMKKLRVLGKQENVRRQRLKDFQARVGKKELFTVYPFIEGFWDGKLYNSKKGEFEPAKDGQYYIEASARINMNEQPQKLLYPIKIDTVKPKITVVKTQDGQDYQITKDGRLVTFKVEDEVGVSTVYGKLGKKKLEAVKQYDGTYTILIPFNIEVSESLNIIANDFALNEVNVDVKGIKGNSLKFVEWKKIVNKKMSSPIYYSGSTTNEDTKSISIQFVNKKTNDVINTKEVPVNRGRFSFASYKLKDDQQGKYEAFAIEKDANKQEIKKTSLGEYVYDFEKPTMEFNYLEEVKGLKVKNPLQLKDTKNYVEYVMLKNPDGTATFKGTVSDNVFEPNELKLTIGSRENVVKIQKDGTFEYVLKAPSAHFDFINLSQPGDDKANSSSIDALDLAIKDPKKGNKGLESTYVINSYKESDKELELPEFKLTTATKVIINKDKIGNDKTIEVEKREDGYYYTLNGFTNRRDNVVYVNGQKATLNDATDGGSRFTQKVKINEGLNAFNLRINDSQGNVLKDIKIRVILDTNLPNLVLENPEVVEVEKVEIPKKETPKDKEGEKTVDYQEYEIIETWKDTVEFKGRISDAGLGYSLIINGDLVEKAENRNKMGTLEREFSKVIAVSDQDIIILELADTAGNSSVIKYKVRKIAPPRIIEVKDSQKEKDEIFARVSVKLLEEKVYDVLKGQVLPEEILPKIEDTEDYKFLGWYLDNEFKTPLENKPISEDMTIYPKFEKIEAESKDEKDTNGKDKENQGEKGSTSPEKDGKVEKAPSDKEDQGKKDSTRPEKGGKVEKAPSDREGNKNIDDKGKNKEDSKMPNDSPKSKTNKDLRDEISKLLPKRDENPQLPQPQPKISDDNHTSPRSEKDSKPSQTDSNKSEDIYNVNVTDDESKEQNNASSSTINEDNKTKEDGKDLKKESSDKKDLDNKVDEKDQASSKDEDTSKDENTSKDETKSNNNLFYYILGGLGVLLLLLLLLFVKRKKDKDKQ